MAQPVHLIVEIGPDRGRKITVPPEGIRVGRSSRNDIVLNDASASRFHCRFTLKPGQGLWVTDLGSANETMVNDKSIQDIQIRPGDMVTIGDSILKVVDDGTSSAPAAPPQPAAPAATASPRSLDRTEPAIDLGLRQHPGPTLKPRSRRPLLVVLLVLVAVGAAAMWLRKPEVWQRLLQRFQSAPPPAAVAPDSTSTFALTYEKVEATSSNIFRYAMGINDGLLTVSIDDVQNNRHVRHEKRVDPDLVRSLAKTVTNSGFFDLLDDYQGLAPGVYYTWDLSITIGRETHRTRVVDRVEPDAFKSIREAVEQFGKDELGLAALALEPAQLVERANEAFLLGCKLYDEKDIQDENLAKAISSFKEAEWYLETIEPKPDFYREAVGRRADCERELQQKYENIRFVAERAIKLRDWSEAAKNLRIICEMIPDRSDERNQSAVKGLLDVERHLGPTQ